ncbi:MAG: alpha-hydroxy-acid oxidizing protein [Candidatus Dormibacteraeota bacterium]|nr:alpha-hydroxy-acid oxidizing protein [Candidatus Dormibacteraeota bacterium]
MYLTIEDLRRKSRRRLPRAVFDFIDGAAEDERAMRANREALTRVRLAPRVLAGVEHVDLTTELFGHTLPVPLVLGPTGLCGMARPRGEIAAGRAAAAAGIPFVASCMAAVRVEEIMREAPGPHWFQIYLWRDRELVRALLERAAKAGFGALVVTVDVPVHGQRERDDRNGATIPPRITLRNAFDAMVHARWFLDMARGPRIEFANAVAPAGGAGRPFALTRFVDDLYDPSATWEDLRWLRGVWHGPLLVKGVLRGDDARRAVDSGADGIVVSNHGGRQLDDAIASLDALPGVVEAAADRVPVLMDGGVRRGSDILKAIALGARACLIARPYLYGLGAAGEQGVARCIEILTTELRRAMALSGVTAVEGIGPDVLSA